MFDLKPLIWAAFGDVFGTFQKKKLALFLVLSNDMLTLQGIR